MTGRPDIEDEKPVTELQTRREEAMLEVLKNLMQTGHVPTDGIAVLALRDVALASLRVAELVIATRTEQKP